MSSVPRVAFPGAAVLGAEPCERLLPEAMAHKLVRVLRLQVGDPFVVFDPESELQADATLRSLSPATAWIGRAHTGLVASRQIRLLQGLAKGDKNESILQDATELGSSCVHFVEMQRSVVRIPKDKRDARRARWAAVAEAAAGQCGRVDRPRVLGPSTLADALAEHQDAQVLVLHEGGGAPLGDVLKVALQSDRPLLLVVGPEGGIAEEDMAVLRRGEMTLCSLGPYVLRTETVAAAALGAALVLGQQSR